MEEFKTNTENLKAHIGEYVNTYIQLTKAKVTQGAANASSAMTVMIGALFFRLILLTVCISGACLVDRKPAQQPCCRILYSGRSFSSYYCIAFYVAKKIYRPPYPKCHYRHYV